MIERVRDVPPGIDAVRADGMLTAQDYTSVVVPLLDEASRANRRIRCLVEVGPGFEGVTPAPPGRT